jgi:hypothetical protein
MTGTGCGGHGSVFNWAHQLLLHPAFCKSHTSCNQWETTSSWNTAVVSNPAFWISTVAYTSNISKIMHSAVCWVLVIIFVQALLSQQHSTELHASIHGWFATFPTPLLPTGLATKFSFLNKQIWKILCTSLSQTASTGRCRVIDFL